MKLRQLEIQLQRCAGYRKPNVDREQYPTPANLAARLLYDAFMQGDIKEKSICDLGCGTGILAIGAALLGAALTRGIEIDPDAIRVAKENSVLLGADVEFIQADITEGIGVLDHSGPCDTVIMNPPFGAQRANVHADRPFIDAALAIAPITYGIFNVGSTPFVEAYLRGRGTISGKVSGCFAIKRSFAFHTCDSREIPIEILKISRS
ncbi:MAG: METTL5 family protein [Methanoregula sp.]|jgi:putative methylase